MSSCRAAPTSTTCSSTSSRSRDDAGRSSRAARSRCTSTQIAKRRGWDLEVRPLPPELHNRPERIRAAVDAARRGRRRVCRLRDARRARRSAAAPGGRLLPALRRHGARARHLLPDRLPRALVRPGRLARPRARPPPRAARRLLPQLRAGRLARAGADGRAAREGRAPQLRSSACRSRFARPATPARTCPRTTTPGGLVADQRTAAVRDPRRVVDAGARARLAAHRLRARHRLRDVRAPRADGRRARGSGPEGRGPARQVRPGLDSRAGREGAARVRPAGAQPGATTSTSAASTWRSARSTAARSCAEGLERREATYDDFENLVRLAQAFPQLDTPGGTICEPNDKPLDSRHLDMVYALLTLSDKPFMGSVTSGPNAARHDRDGRDGVRPRVARADAGDHQPDQRQLAASLRRADAGRAARLREARTRRW